VSDVVDRALAEDLGAGDTTTRAVVPDGAEARARINQKEPGMIAGLRVARTVFERVDPELVFVAHCPEGKWRELGAIAEITGAAASILAAERVALNFLGRLSGIASLTARYVDAVAGTSARIVDTRKTTPGWRKLEKYAVRAGGGLNHRMDLATGVLIKDNHLAAVDGDVALAVRRAREKAPAGMRIEVECDRPEQVEAAVAAGADIIMLDNMHITTMRECVELVNGRAVVEASGGVTLETVRAIAMTGVDWISVGALTHSAPSMDVALDFDPA